MKGSRELKQYITRNKKRLQDYHWDDLLLFKLQDSCKKWYKRRKSITAEELDQ